MGVRVYIHKEQYAVLSRLMAHCQRKTSWPPVGGSRDAPGLYYSRRDDLEIVTPACLVLLSHPKYDQAHVRILGHTGTIRLTNLPSLPGWWKVSEESRHVYAD